MDKCWKLVYLFHWISSFSVSTDGVVTKYIASLFSDPLGPPHFIYVCFEMDAMLCDVRHLRWIKEDHLTAYALVQSAYLMMIWIVLVPFPFIRHIYRLAFPTCCLALTVALSLPHTRRHIKLCADYLLASIAKSNGFNRVEWVWVLLSCYTSQMSLQLP